MREVVLELGVGVGWERLGSVGQAEPPGSLSNHEPSGRQVYLFGWDEGDGPAVWRSEGGYDVSNEAVRNVATLGLVKVADLDAGPHEMPFWRGGRPTPLRFRVEDAR